MNRALSILPSTSVGANRMSFPVAPLRRIAICFGLTVACASQPLPAAPASAAEQFLADAQRTVAEAQEHNVRWTGPIDGPAAQPHKTIVYITDDLRNGGTAGVLEGVREAVRTIGWKLHVLDGKGQPAALDNALAEALKSAPDGVIFSGVDARTRQSELMAFSMRGIPVVGWHAGPRPGPIAGTPVAMNITTDPLRVAQITAMAAVAQSNGRAGVVIFTDARYGIAMTKASTMASVIRACSGCTLLETQNIPLSDTVNLTPPVVQALLTRFGKRWTHALAINDLYFDAAVPTLQQIGLAEGSISMLSAGDGSPSAFSRIRLGQFQTGTVAEPLNLQGWQAVDELNRLFAGQPVSGFVAPVHLVTRDNLSGDGANRLRYDPDNGYRMIYRQIWRR